MKRSPMPPRRTRLRSTSDIARKRRIQPMSKSYRQTNTSRRKNMIAAYGQNPECQARWDEGCSGWADDAHEPGMRSRGADPTDPAQAIPVCRHCHGEIHRNVAEATRRGLLVPSWERAS